MVVSTAESKKDPGLNPGRGLFCVEFPCSPVFGWAFFG